MTEAFFFYLPLQLGGSAMKVYTIIGGVNGTGKTSFTGVLKTQRTDLGTIIDVDKITAQNGGSAIIGGKIALERIQDCMSKGVSFTQETTLAGHRTEQTAAKAKAQGYYIRLCYVGLDTLEESLARIENRVRRGGHDIRDEDVTRRFAGRWEAVAKVLPYCDEARFFDNDNGFVEVAEYVNGELLQKGDKLSLWCKELAEYLKHH
jgi:predicted ABC-type ATPase